MTRVLLLANAGVEAPALSALDAPGVSVVRCLDAVDLHARMIAGGGDAVVIDGPRTDVDLATVEHIERHCRGGVVVVDSADGRRWAASLGLAAVVDLAEISTLADRVLGLDPPVAGGPVDASGRIVAVWGPVGAPGRTTVAVGLAGELALRANERVLLVDADTYGASIAQHLGLLDDVSGVLAASRAVNQGRDTGTASFLKEFTAGLGPRLDVLTGLPRADLWRHVRPRAWTRVLEAAVASYTTVVVDVGFCLEPPDNPERPGHHRHHLALETVARARSVVAVGSADPVGLARLVRGLDEIAELGIDPDVRLVINRSDPATGWKPRDVHGTLASLTGHRAVAILPYDHGTAAGSVAAGRTLAEFDAEAPVVRSLRSFAQTL